MTLLALVLVTACPPARMLTLMSTKIYSASEGYDPVIEEVRYVCILV